MAFTQDDVVLGAAPFSHVLGQSTGIVSTLLAGAAVSVVERFEPEQTLATMTATRTTILLGVPTMCIALCQAARSADELPPVRIAHVGGAAVPVEVARDFERTFGGDVYEGYGLTELSGIATTYTVGQERKPGSVGMPLGGTEMRIHDPDERGVGEVQFRGPSVIPGYWNDHEATSRGDRRRRLAGHGRHRLRGRRRLSLPRRPQEGADHPRRLQRLPARGRGGAVRASRTCSRRRSSVSRTRRSARRSRRSSCADPARRSTSDELQAWAKERVAAYKYPRRIVVRRRAAEGPDGEDPQARDRPLGARRRVAERDASRPRATPAAGTAHARPPIGSMKRWATRGAPGSPLTPRGVGQTGRSRVLEAQTRPRRHRAPRGGGAVRLLDRAGEPHEWLCETEARHDAEPNHPAPCSGRNALCLLVPR